MLFKLQAKKYIYTSSSTLEKSNDKISKTLTSVENSTKFKISTFYFSKMHPSAPLAGIFLKGKFTVDWKLLTLL